MTSIPEDRRGVGNAPRSTIQNGAGVADTAIVVALTAGNSNAADHYAIIFTILAIACIAATAVSLTRPPATEHA